MAVLTNSKHEQFAQAVARGESLSAAYRKAGYSAAGSAQSANRLLRNAEVSARVRELQETLSAATIALEITGRNGRLQALQERWNFLRASLDTLLRERGQELADIPGGSTGLLVRDYKGRDATQPVYKIDSGVVAVLGELREMEKHAAIEMGQWQSKAELTVKGEAPKPILPAWLLEHFARGPAPIDGSPAALTRALLQNRRALDAVEAVFDAVPPDKLIDGKVK